MEIEIKMLIKLLYLNTYVMKLTRPGLIETKDIVYSCCKGILGVGAKTRFSESVGGNLCVLFSRIYHLCLLKMDLLLECLLF
jgi:hypothetical protein